MKKLAAFIVAVMYMGFNVGATLHLHYCMGEHVATSLFSLKNEKCGKCGMQKHTEASKDCCKDVSITIKNDNSHIYSQAVYTVTPLTAIFSPADFTLTNFTIPEAQPEKLLRVLNPPLQHPPLYLSFENFRI